MQYSYIRSKAIRQLVKERGKRCGPTFLAALDRMVHDKVNRCLEIHNGNVKTLDDSLVNIVK